MIRFQRHVFSIKIWHRMVEIYTCANHFCIGTHSHSYYCFRVCGHYHGTLCTQFFMSYGLFFGNALLKCETQPFIKQLILLVKFCVVLTSESINSRQYYSLLQMLHVTKSWYGSIYYFYFRGIKCSIVKNKCIWPNFIHFTFGK